MNDINKKISQFVDVVATDETSLIPIVQGSPLFNAKITPENLAKSIAEQVKISANLDRVDNTPDLEKPVSNPTQDALDLKLDIQDGINNYLSRDELAAITAEELIRISNESARIDAESARATNEIARVNSNNLMQDSEAWRVNRENQREINEALRISAEIARNNAEVLREQAKADTIEATENANTATGLAIAATADYYDVVKPQIISQGEYATAQGDYAKAQGEAVEGAITDLQTDLAQLADEVSLLDAVQSAKIKDIENVLSTANLNQSAQLSVSGVSPLSLPKNAANGGMSMKLEGLTAENEVVNGDFRDGTGTSGQPNHWSSIGIKNVSISENVFYAENMVTYDHSIGKNVALTARNKYYFTYFYSTNNPNKWTAFLYYDEGKLTTNHLSMVSINQWNKYSDVLNIVSGSPRISVGIYGLMEEASWKVKDIKLINLTETFGAGNEPTKEQCDIIFSDYFEGVKSFEPTGRVRSVGKNILTPKMVVDSYTNINMNLTLDGFKYSTVGNMGNYFQPLDFVKPNTQYMLSWKSRMASKSHPDTNSGFGVKYTDGTASMVTIRADEYTYHSFITPAGKTVERFSSTWAYSGIVEIKEICMVETAVETPYEPYKETNLYLTAPELRSNELVKDEIRKGTNGYELVKRVGVGNITGAVEKIINNTFETDLNGWSAFAGTISREAGTRTGGSGSYVMRVVSDGMQGSCRRISILTTGKWYKITGWAKSDGTSVPIISVGGSDSAGWRGTESTSWQYFSFFVQCAGASFYLRSSGGAGTYTDWDDVYCYELPIAGDISSTSTITELSNNIIHYTFATPIITPISYGGILNSAENGTVYHEPIIADAGVYGTNMPILLTDYPIATIEEIIKHENGVDTYLDVATAVITGDGLSFTHPNLASGDLVLFTYAFDKESTKGNITASFYDSNVVKIDTVTGKAYKINEVVTNGILTRTLTEV